jgi:uncharacterized membrane protein YdbT with pleckstrin-like domain
MAHSYITKVLGKEERVVFVTRKHRFVLLSQVLSEAVLAIAVASLITFVWRRWDPYPKLPYLYLVLIFPLLSLTVDVMRWRRQQYFVTTRRVVEVNGILNKEVTDSSLEKINDIRMTQSLLGRIFDFGDLEILTASEAGLNRFSAVHHPIKFKTAMLDAKLEVSRGRSSEPGPSTEAGILGLLSHLDKLHENGVLTRQEADKKKAELLARLEAKA